MENNYKLILSDLDETLLVNHRVPAINLKAIEKAKLKGVKFVPCTGRGYMLVQDVMKDLGTYQQEDEYCICYNGGMIVENKNDKVLYFKGLEFDVACQLVKQANEYDVGVLVFTKDHCYMYRPLQIEIDRKNAQNCPYTILSSDDISILKNHEIAKVLYVNTKLDYLKEIVAKNQSLIEMLGVEISYSSGRYLEFNAHGVNKGFGLRWLANYLGLDVSQTIAIGDNYNDVEMIKAAGLGVCVSSGQEDVKLLAKYIPTLDYDEGAVSEVIEKFVIGGSGDGV